MIRWSESDGPRGWYNRGIAEVCRAIGRYLDHRQFEPVSADEIEEWVLSRDRAEIYATLSGAERPEIRFAAVHLHPENGATASTVWSGVCEAARGDVPANTLSDASVDGGS